MKDVIPATEWEAKYHELDYQCKRAYDILNDAFGHADAPYTPAALQAMAILSEAINAKNESSDRHSL